VFDVTEETFNADVSAPHRAHRGPVGRVVGRASSSPGAREMPPRRAASGFWKGHGTNPS
jgi:hypothetical protein